MSFEEEYNRRLRTVLATRSGVEADAVVAVSVEIFAAGSEEDSRGIDKSLDVTGICAGRAISAEFATMADLISALDAVPDE